MLPQAQTAARPDADLAGDPGPLLERLGYFGGPNGLAGAENVLVTRQIKTVAGLSTFLRHYHAVILRPLELPAIRRAYEHAGRHEFRELLTLDRELAGQPALQQFAAASRRAGLTQLERLRPLRDERLARKYRDAVEAGGAHGWHTVVYGINLAIYSLPLRQGLHGYAQLTTRGFIEAAARSMEIPKEEARALAAELCTNLSESVEPLLAAALV